MKTFLFLAAIGIVVGGLAVMDRATPIQAEVVEVTPVTAAQHAVSVNPSGISVVVDGTRRTLSLEQVITLIRQGTTVYLDDQAYDTGEHVIRQQPKTTTRAGAGRSAGIHYAGR